MNSPSMSITIFNNFLNIQRKMLVMDRIRFDADKKMGLLKGANHHYDGIKANTMYCL
jgi:hypothetical protein